MARVSFDSDAIFGTRTASGQYLFWETSAWQPQNGKDERIETLKGTTRLGQALFEDPMFADRADEDFRLQDSSPCKGQSLIADDLGVMLSEVHRARVVSCGEVE